MKALVLYSGGLDSTLALKVIADQGIDIIVLSFMSPFCRCDCSKGCSLMAQKGAGAFGLEYKLLYLGEEYLQMVRKPKYGYGKNFNPCIDCRILMFTHAKKFMQQAGASFIVTGEVLGQRPKSQHKQALRIIEQESGLEGLIVRPLSAKRLPPTIAEEKGWIKREALFDMCGRGRKPQMQMATSFGIKNYPCPAGGCLLTDPSFCRRLKDLMRYRPHFNCKDIELLKLGRHFRLSNKAKLIVARDESEGRRLEKFFNDGFIQFTPDDAVGFFSLGVGKFRPQDYQLASAIVGRYCQKDIMKITVRIVESDKETTVEIDSSGYDKKTIEQFLI